MFSVLLSVYIKESPVYFSQSLDSIFSQTLLPDEVVLVKDGPLTVKLEEVISRYTQMYAILKVVPLAQNQGLGKALNIGLKHCSYDIVARMDTDDIAKTDRFEKQIVIFEQFPDIDVVGSWVDEFDGDINKIISVKKVPETSTQILKFAKSRNPINHPAVMFRKEAVIKVGSYQHFPLFEDYYLWVRMLVNGCHFYNIQESLLFFRCSKQMIGRRGGGKYMLNELKFQCKIREIGFISFKDYARNICIRLIVRILPNSCRSFIYRCLLRK